MKKQGRHDRHVARILCPDSLVGILFFVFLIGIAAVAAIEIKLRAVSTGFKKLGIWAYLKKNLLAFTFRIEQLFSERDNK